MTQFRIDVVIDPRRAKTGSKKVRTEIEKINGSAQKLRKTLGQAIGVLAVGAGIAAGTRKLADFSQEMSSVAAITRATAQEFDSLQAKALELGSRTRFSASQAAEGMTFLARAGFEADEVLGTIEATLNLAQAGALELGAAADIASNALTAFRLEVSESARVVDVLALAANSSNTTVAQLGDGLKLVAPIAAGVGVEIEEVTGAISALSNAGLQATLAGTGLRRVISELESPSTKTKKTLKQLGLDTEDYKISSVGLTVALKALADQGVDTGLGLEIFGDRGGPAFEVLSSSIGDVEDFTFALQNAEGTAARIAATMDDNLNGSILAAKSAFEGLVLSAGEAGATGSLRGFFDLTAAGLRALTNNIELVTVATVGLGTALAVVKLGPLAASATAAAKAFVLLQVATIKGTSASALAAVAAHAEAVANAEAAAATAAKAAADLAAAEAGIAKGLVVVGNTNATFIAAAAETQLAAATAANTVATEALTAAQLKLDAATKATSKSMRIASLVNPFTAAVVGIAAAGAGLAILLDKFKEVEEQELRTTEAGIKFALSDFSKLNIDIAKVNEELARFEKLAKQDKAAGKEVYEGLTRATEAAKEKLERLTQAQNLLRDGSAKNIEGANQQILALERLDVASNAVVESIEQENKLLGENSRERQIQAALLQEIADLETDEAKLDDGQKAEIEAALRRNQALTDQASAFEAIRGPQQAFNAQVAALTALEEKGRISTEELNVALGELAGTASDLDLSALNEAAGGEDLAAKIKAQVEATRAQAKAEGDRARILQELQDPLIALEERQRAIIELVKEGTVTETNGRIAYEKTAEAIRLLNPEYAAQAALLEELNGPQERAQERLAALNALNAQGVISSAAYKAELAKLNEVLHPLNEEQQRQADILAEIQDPIQQQADRITALTALLDAGTISQQAFNKELERMGVAAETTNTAVDGFKIGLKNSVDEMTDVQGAAQDLTENGFRAAEEALVSFVKTGELDFEAFVDGLIDDIARLLVKQALLAAFGGGSAGAVGAIAGGRAEGGPVQKGKTFLVGEEGPELFTPPQGGNITPAGETAAKMAGSQQAAPVVNVAAPAVNITNVSDPSEVPSGIESPEGEAAVMNVVRRRRREFNGITG